jgi:hypothetical protein
MHVGQAGSGHGIDAPVLAKWRVWNSPWPMYGGDRCYTDSIKGALISLLFLEDLARECAAKL